MLRQIYYYKKRQRKKGKGNCRTIFQMNIGSKIQTKYIKGNPWAYKRFIPQDQMPYIPGLKA